MKIALIGYGKMGKAIEEVNASLGEPHEIVLKIHSRNTELMTPQNLKKADVAIEFTTPASAYANILKCFEAGIPVVCGTTGWTDRLPAIKTICEQQGQAMVYAPNFSIGVNIFFALNRWFAQLMNRFPQYDIEIEEIHHTAKKDAPSGTAIRLAEELLEVYSRKNRWVKGTGDDPQAVPVQSKRIADVPGTHILRYTSADDEIVLQHTAFSRKGFARGAIIAAEWITGRKGYYEMKDILQLA